MDRRGRVAELRERVLGEENLTRLLLWLAAPLFLSASVNTLYELVDTFWLSRLGSAALGTPTVSWPYRGLLMSIAFGVASSSSALIGQYIGAGRYGEAERALGTVASLLLAITVPGTLLLMAGVPLYLDAIGVPGDVRPLATLYLEAIVASLPFTSVTMLYNFVLGAVGDTRTPVYVSAAASLLNAVLDPIMIFGAGLGVLGAGLATAISDAAAGVYALLDLRSGRRGLRLRLGVERGLLPLVARVSGPMTAQRLGMTTGFAVMSGIVSGLGTPVLAAYSIGQIVLGIDRIIAMPLARATGIVVAQALGAGLASRAREAVAKGARLMLASVGSYVAFLLAARPWFIGVFTSDPAVAAAADRMLLIFGPSVLGFNLFILANVVARSSGHTFFVSALGVARLWLLRIPLSYHLAYTMGLGDKGLWAGMALSNYIVGAAAAAWLATGRWAKPVIREAGTPPARGEKGLAD